MHSNIKIGLVTLYRDDDITYICYNMDQNEVNWIIVYADLQSWIGQVCYSYAQYSIRPNETVLI